MLSYEQTRQVIPGNIIPAGGEQAGLVENARARVAILSTLVRLA